MQAKINTVSLNIPLSIVTGSWIFSFGIGLWNRGFFLYFLRDTEVEKKMFFLWLPPNILTWFSFLLMIASLYYEDLSSSDYIQYISHMILPEWHMTECMTRNMTESLHHWGVSQDNEHDRGQDFISCECNSPRNVLQTTLIPVQMSEWTLVGFSFAEELRSDNKTESASKMK